MAEPVWDDEAGEWVYPEDDGSEELEDTPGEALWRQKQQLTLLFMSPACLTLSKLFMWKQ